MTEAAVEAGIARCKAHSRAYHRIASGSGVDGANVAVNLESEFDLGQPPKQRTREEILFLHHLLHQNLVGTWLYLQLPCAMSRKSEPSGRQRHGPQRLVGAM